MSVFLFYFIIFDKLNCLKNFFYILFFGLLLFLSCNNKNNNNNSNDEFTIIMNDDEMNLKSKTELNLLNEKALEAINKHENSPKKRDYLLRITQNFIKLGKPKYFKQANDELLKNSLDSNDSLKIAYAYYYYGNEYYNSSIIDSAFYYYIKSEKLFLQKKDSTILADLYLKKSSLQIEVSDFQGAQLSAIKSLRVSKNRNDMLGAYDALTNLGISSTGQDNYAESISYYNKTLVIAKNNNFEQDYFLQSVSLNNIGNSYLNLKNYKNAISKFQEALLEKKLLKQKPQIYSIILENLAYSKFKIGDRKQLPYLFFESLKIADSLKLKSRSVYTRIHLSEFFFSEKDSINAQKYASQALEIAQETKILYDLLTSLKQISLVEHKNSAKYSKEYIKINDSLQIEERKSKDKFARIAFETDEIIQEKDKLAEQNRSLLYFFIGTLFVGLLLFVIRTQRAKNRELLLKQQQQKVNEEIYNLMISQQATIEENRVKEKKRIAQELHDGVLGRLFGARLNLDSLNRFTDDESITSRFNYLAELKNIEQDIREISHDLNREKYVLINNFVAIVSNLLEEQANSFEAELTSSLDESIQWDKVSNAVKINLYRILQESLQNINKYASAKHISVEFKKENDQIVFTITDDGIGFDVNTKKRGIGLQNMQSRVNECEGTFDIKSKKGKGTTTVVAVPIEKKSIEVE